MEEVINYTNDTITYNVEHFMEDMDEVCTCIQTYGVLKNRMENYDIIFELLANDEEELEQLLKCFILEDGEYKAKWDFAKPYLEDFIEFIELVKDSMIDDSFNCDVENYDEMFDVFRCVYECFYNEIIDDYYKDRPEELKKDCGGDIATLYFNYLYNYE